MFLFISKLCMMKTLFLLIQIHPMFLFIPSRMSFSSYSSNSNTSYVLIHLDSFCGFPSSIFIQIHPMFLFIRIRPDGCCKHQRFKYILCSYSSSSCVHSLLFLNIQIHPMFLFIIVPKLTRSRFPVFKYILCSYSSKRRLAAYGDYAIQIHPMFLFIS